MSILIFGATGNTGTVIVGKLKEEKENFSIFAENLDSASKLGLREDQVYVGSFDDKDSLINAMKGISRIYLLMPIHPDTITWTKNVLHAAKEAGVDCIVKQSGFRAPKNAKSQVIRDHAQTDELIKNSGLDFTILQCNSFMQNMYGNLPTINNEGKFYLPLGSSLQSIVDIGDVASVAVQVLREPGHEGMTYALSGPEALSSAKQASIISDISGKKIQYVATLKDDTEKTLKSYGMDDWMAENLSETLAWFTDPLYAEVTNDIERILGRKPRSFSEFAKELSAAIEK